MPLEPNSASGNTSIPETDSKPGSQPGRVASIDAVRGLVMFTMIFVNYLAGAGEWCPTGWCTSATATQTPAA